MKFVFQVIFICLTAYVLELFFPWWTIAIAAFIFGYMLRSKANFLAGFLGVGLLWAFKAYLIEANAAAPLTQKVAEIFSLNKHLLFALTVFLGGLVGGFAAVTGSLLRKKKKDLYY
jgi:hypothetical protein